MHKHITEHRVRYADTDHFGVVYYARYLDWFEAGRTEILRDKGITYADLEKKGFFAPVVEVKVNYKKPARYDDIVVVETTIENIGNSSIKFNYKVFNKETNELLCEAYTVNVFINKEMKSQRIPDDVRGVLS
ncbi:MAG: acyl-CoA thioesterase [Nanoarchaeota archaeon]|nr:acyl-CoA thioesterase [Nanoarchaeota archaeon]MBU1004639.1 acyl-CoA thioesterase [Nanoarchaeota archaeon]MBU1946193.1 acyl-CoA thioesterase [Nanoarchaeota archaeon]